MFKSRNQNPPTYASLFLKNQKGDKNKNLILPVPAPEQQLNEPISYEQFMKHRKHLVQHQSSLQPNSQTFLPTKYIIIHLLILTVASLILIGLQIVVIDRNQPFSNIASGIWIGAYNFVLIVLCLITIKYQKRILILVIENMHIIGCVLTLGAIIGLNSIIIMNSTCQQKLNCMNSSLSSSSSSSGSSSNTATSSVGDININILFISIGVVCVILYMTFFICIECTIKSNFNGSSTNSRQIYPIVTETN